MGFIKNAIESFLLNAINVDRYLPIQLDITNACNLKCVHCYHPHHKNDGAISLNDWKNILLQYKKMILKMKFRPMVMICGGEPLTSPFLFQLMDFIKLEMPVAKISILSNGTLLTAATALKLKSYSDLKFQISLDGPDAVRHDMIRGRGNFEKAMAGIRLLQSHNFEVNVLSVLSQKTAPWMEDFFKLARSENFGSMNFVRFVPEGYGRKLLENTEDQPLLGSALKVAYQKLIHLIVKYQVNSKTQAPLFDLVIPGAGRSGRYWESLVIDYQGYVIASSRSKLRLGHAIVDGLENIFLNHPIYHSLRQGKVDVCGTCSLNSVCGGDRNAAYAATGNFLGPDPGCWKQESEKEQKTFTRRAL
ncbi:MAG: radical SAM protein [Pseudobdellovibrio sp.]